MGLKEELQKRKERNEAIKYFRQNNDAFLSPGKYIYITLCIIGISLVSGFIQAALTTGTGWRLGFVYLITAYLIALVAKKASSYVNNNVKIICYIGYVIAIISTPIFMTANYIGLHYLPSLLFNVSMWINALTSLLQPDIFGWIFYIMGAYELTILLK